MTDPSTAFPLPPRQRIAVIGAGIAGHGAAWALAKDHEVTLYEAADYFGGHSDTAEVSGANGQPINIDMGFIVYNTHNYPELTALFETLGVATEASNMSFGVSMDGGGFEYCGSGIKGVLAQPLNALRPRFLRMLFDLKRFYQTAAIDLMGADQEDVPLGETLKTLGYSESFIDDHIVPMAAAIWSAPASQILAFPTASFVRFFDNHRLFLFKGRPQWRTVTGGSRSYVEALHQDGHFRAFHSAPVEAVVREENGVLVKLATSEERYDHVIIATHADQALKLLATPTAPERSLLSQFDYSTNQTYLHTDASVMPKRRAVWSAWNYVERDAKERENPDAPVPVSYWMNRLQNISGPIDYFVTLNPQTPIPEDKVLRTRQYSHPIFDGKAIRAQRDLGMLATDPLISFCGSYFGYGFHEDALRSGLNVARRLGAVLPWEASKTKRAAA